MLASASRTSWHAMPCHTTRDHSKISPGQLHASARITVTLFTCPCALRCAALRALQTQVLRIYSDGIRSGIIGACMWWTRRSQHAAQYSTGYCMQLQENNRPPAGRPCIHHPWNILHFIAPLGRSLCSHPPLLRLCVSERCEFCCTCAALFEIETSREC